jgi:hypothetical protein
MPKIKKRYFLRINKEIDEGKYDNLKPMSKQEFRDKLSEILKNKIK